ncbi:MAG: M56 family metallopeptidase [Planctomycetota bacterium]|jgi:beta-lactamase regulating signal transducer with metallopeptidase domain/peroxiredoxin
MIGSCISILNDVGSDFCRYALAMLIQSSILIALLLVADWFLRKRLRAVVRYWIWLLVFIKLILPPTLHLPTGIGCWFGDYLSADSAVMTAPDPTSNDTAGYALTDAASAVPPAAFVESAEPVISHSAETFGDTSTAAGIETAALPALTWQAALFLGWLAGVVLLAGFVIRRFLVIRGYVVRSQPAQGRLTELLNECRGQLRIRRAVELRITQQAISPAAYGLLRPKILLSASAISRLPRDRLRTILIHELAHIKRGDLWMNVTQSVLQVIYFYNPLVWSANAVVRQVREQAVDEMVLVCLGNEPRDYSSTLVDIAELALPHPSLGLQLIGVVESRKALAQRVKHIMTRPIPRTARVGIIGLAAVAVIAAVLLPMARAKGPVPRATPAATKRTEPVDQQITGAELMEDSMIVDGLMPAIKLAVEGKVGEERPRIPRIHSEPGPGVLHGIIIDRADTSKHTAGLFFVPVEKWPGKALFWYLANVNESFEITGIPPGEYCLFSVETSNPRNIDSVGLSVDWPRPVNIRADGEPAQVEIEVSSWLSKKARWWNMQSFLRGLGHLNAENVLTEQLGPFGRVTDSQGNPLPYAQVQVREFKPNRGRGEGIRAPDARANKDAYYGMEPLDYPYFVGAIVHEPLKDVAGYRWRYLKRNKVFEGKQEINFQFAPWPAQLTGGGTIEGTVVDANGQAIPSFTVDVRGGKPSVWPHETNEPWSQRWGLRAAFANGKFVIEDVPAGACNIRVSSHKSSSAGGARLARRQVTVPGGRKIELIFEVEDWQTKRAHRPVARAGRGRRPAAAEEEPREPLPELKVGEQAPAFEIQTVDGRKWALTDYRDKVVLLCFWQAHHQPTESQFPYFKSTYEAFGADERFVMMSLVRKARRLKDLQQYVTRHDLNWDHALMDDEVRQRLAADYGVQRWPSVILIGPDGKIIARNLKGNAMSWAVEKALKDQTASPR